MKIVTRNEIEFSELFNFASDEFNIDWNSANDLFFGGVANYEGVSDWGIGDCFGMTREHESNKDISEYTKDEILAMPREDIAWFILGKLMDKLNVTTLRINGN